MTGPLVPPLLAARRRFPSTPHAVDWHARHAPDATAVVETGRSVSYAGLAGDVARCIGHLHERGVRRGGLVGVETRPDRYRLLVVLLACEAIQATVAPISGAELLPDDPVVRRCGLLLLRGVPAVTGLPPCHIIGPATRGVFEGTPATGAGLGGLLQPVDPDLIMRISRTSGTTGKAKRIPNTFRTMQRMVDDQFDDTPAHFRLPAILLCLYNAGIRHVHCWVLATLQAGGTVLLAREEEAPALIEAGFVNHVLLLTGDAERVARATRPTPHRESTVAIIAGAWASPALRGLVRERIGQHLTIPYASNETNRISIVGDDDVGRLVPGASVRIVDENGVELPMGATGIIQARTTTMVDGYFEDPEATRAAFVDGWYHTNDAGRTPEPGKLVVLGRADDMLNIGGIKIAPHAIEDEIRTIDGVSDAALIAVPNQSGIGELVVAVETTGGGLPPGAAASVQRIVGRHLRHHRLFPLPSFPRTESGKVRRKDIEAAFARRNG